MWVPPADGYKVLVGESGIYRIYGSELVGAGVDIDSMITDRIKLYNEGKEASIYINEGKDKKFAGYKTSYTRSHRRWTQRVYDARQNKYVENHLFRGYNG